MAMNWKGKMQKDRISSIQITCMKPFQTYGKRCNEKLNPDENAIYALRTPSYPE
uniref:Uncharacterized protein n=1 Tax=Rhizophora mucronata TaxID=61149 RepID=A0A2P2PAL6_RHIMU